MSDKTEKISAISLITQWLRRLDIGGCNPKNTAFSSRIKSYFFISYNNLMILLVFLNALFTEYESIGQFAEDFIIVLGFIQETIKITAYLINAKLLSNMIDTIWNDFWPVEVSENVENQNKVLKTYKILKIVARCYEFNILGATLFYIAGTFIRGNRSLPMNIWIPNKEILKEPYYYEIVSFLEVILTISSAAFCLIPIDCLFIVMIGLVFSQFNLINEKLLKIGETDNNLQDYKIIIKCIKHHNLLLSFLEKIETVYSKALLITLGTNLLLNTMCMYAFVMESEKSRQATFMGILSGVFFQLLFYCQTGQIIQDKVESIGRAAYKCKWPNVPDKNIRLALRLIILRSQRRFNITMGGFMVLNLETFATIVRASFSFLTFLENMKS